jgi:hypothetical protein
LQAKVEVLAAGFVFAGGKLGGPFCCKQIAQHMSQCACECDGVAIFVCVLYFVLSLYVFFLFAR